MRKKTIKFYFFNQKTLSPSISYLNFFSKRFIKQQKMVKKIKYLKYLRTKKKKIETVNYFLQNKNLIFKKFKYNQLFSKKQAIHNLFLKSYFNKKKNTKGERLYFWYFFKNFYFNKLNNYLYKFFKRGIMSSHFVHFLIKKNFTYQTYSKYKAQLYDLNYNLYYNKCRLLYIYNIMLKNKIYHYTNDFSRVNFWVDTNFNYYYEPWYSYTLKNDRQYVKKFLYNGINMVINDTYSNKNICEIFKQKILINQFSVELDTKKKEVFFSELTANLQNTQFALNVFNSAILLDQSVEQKVLFKHNKYIYMYIIFYYNFYIGLRY